MFINISKAKFLQWILLVVKKTETADPILEKAVVPSLQDIGGALLSRSRNHIKPASECKVKAMQKPCDARMFGLFT